jgi:hypothetical protein
MKSKLNQSMFIILLVALSVVFQNISAKEQNIVNLDSIRVDIQHLASDKFAGRGPLTKGEKLTIDYLAKQYESIGLAGANNGSFFHPVPMAKVIINQDMKLRIGDMTFNNGVDFTARTEKIENKVALDDSDIVYVGYGINAP